MSRRAKPSPWDRLLSLCLSIAVGIVGLVVLVALPDAPATTRGAGLVLVLFGVAGLRLDREVVYAKLSRARRESRQALVARLLKLSVRRRWRGAVAASAAGAGAGAELEAGPGS